MKDLNKDLDAFALDIARLSMDFDKELEKVKARFNVEMVDTHESFQQKLAEMTGISNVEEKVAEKNEEVVPKPFDEVVTEELLNKSKKASINSNIVKYKPKKLKKIVADVAPYVASVAILGAALGVGATNVIDNHYQNVRIADEQQEYKSVLNDFTTTNITYNENSKNYSPVHSHDWDKIISEAHSNYGDPLTAFYFIYSNLDDYCKSEDINYIMTIFNKYYQTDYKDLGDLLSRNNLKDLKDLREYVGYDLSNLDEGRGL